MGFADIDLERLEHFKSLGFSPSCIFDVGASNGSWSWTIRDVFPGAACHMFEPLVETWRPYRTTLDQLLASGWSPHVHPVALGATSGTMRLAVSKDATGSSILVERPSEFFPEILSVPVDTIDDLVARGSVPCPQLIKMDVQGGELQILEGAIETLPRVDILLLETWLVRAYGPATPLFPEVANWLARRGFFAADLGDCYRDRHGVLTAQDVFFVNARTTVEGMCANRSYVAA